MELMKRTKKQPQYIGLGILTALIISFLGSLGYIYFFDDKYSFSKTWQMIQITGLYGQMLAFGSLPNLLLFMFCMQRRKENFALGILWASLGMALFVLSHNLLE